MLSLEEMKRLKQAYGYSNQWIAEKTGIPLATVMKVFGGVTRTPRYETLKALEKAFDSESGYSVSNLSDSLIKEPSPAYTAGHKPRPADPWPDQGNYTAEDYFRLPEDARAELIDGRFYAMSAPSFLHQEILGQLYMQFQECAAMHGQNCRVFFSPVNVRLDEDDRTMVQPDLIVVCSVEKIGKNVFSGAPDLVVEIMSPSSRSVDAVLKLNKYLRAGVKEYWLADPETRTINVYRRSEDVIMKIYTFDDNIPVGISEDKCRIDFSRIDAELLFYNEK